MSSKHIFPIIGGPGLWDLQQALFASTGARWFTIKVTVEGDIRGEGHQTDEVEIFVNQVGRKIGGVRGTDWAISGKSNVPYHDGEELGSVVLTYNTVTRRGEMWVDRLAGA